MATYFQNILQNAAAKGIVGQTSKESINWFRDSIRRTRMDPTRLLKEEKANLVDSWTNVGIGKMYFATYDPKHKKTLPYYDIFPIIIPIHKYSDGFLSINAHYLPPVLRAKLLDALYDTLNNTKFDETTKLKITYGILQAASKNRYFQPCIKRYLGKHFRSRFLRVPSAQWTMAMFMPVETFEGATKSQVWNDSRKMIT